MNAKERTAQDIKLYTRALSQERQMLKILTQLPTYLIEQECSSINGYVGIHPFSYTVHISLTSEHPDDLMRLLQTEGFQGFKTTYSPWAKEWHGEDGKASITVESEELPVKVVVTVRGVEQPPKCHLEEKTRTITEMVAVCEEDEPEVVTA